MGPKPMSVDGSPSVPSANPLVASPSFCVGASSVGERVDVFLVHALANQIGRARAKQLIADGSVRVNGHRVRKGDRLSQGDEITVELSTSLAMDAIPEPNAELEVLWQSAELVVVNKPEGIPSAPLEPGETGTLANALVGHFPEMAEVGYGPREPGLLHRLDTHTSGVMLAAKTTRAFDALRGALHHGLLHKDYLLVCRSEGLAKDGVIQLALAPEAKDKQRVRVDTRPRMETSSSGARIPKTTYRVLLSTGPWALVLASAPTAFRHQVRAHFAAIGYPLAGDSLYGGDGTALHRHALHAFRIAWKGDAGVDGFDVHVSPPESFRVLLGCEPDAWERVLTEVLDSGLAQPG